MSALRKRLTELEARLAAPIGRWHRIMVHGQTEAQARAAYEAEHGIIPEHDSICFRVIVTPP